MDWLLLKLCFLPFVSCPVVPRFQPIIERYTDGLYRVETPEVICYGQDKVIFHCKDKEIKSLKYFEDCR
jgi:hypothetical protein